MTRYRAGSGRSRRALAWALAYALVLQLVLTSAFAATFLSGAAQDGGIICRGDISAAPQGQDGGTSQPFTHCPLCLSRADVAGLPPPPVALPAEPFTVALRYAVEREIAPVALPARAAHQPRAPPPAV